MGTAPSSGNGGKRVLIWGKTYPELSSRYRETVCTGGCFEDGRPVRLYPIPLRYLPEVQRYSLYSWVDAPLVDSSQDRRPESYRLARPQIDVLDRVPTDKGWIARREIIFKDRSWHYECLRDLEARQQADKSSMGFVPVGSVDKVWLEKRSDDDRDSHEAKYRRLLAQARQQDLFTVDQQTVRFLEFQPWRVRVAWHCRRLDGPDACPGHTAAVLDWGLGELGRREGWDKARDKMEALGDLGEYDLAFFCGNFKAYPNRFGVVGVWYPKRRDTARWEAAQAQGSLF